MIELEAQGPERLARALGVSSSAHTFLFDARDSPVKVGDARELFGKL